MRPFRILLVGFGVGLAILAVRWWLHDQRATNSGTGVNSAPFHDEGFAGQSANHAVLSGPKRIAPTPISLGHPLPEAVLMDQEGRQFRLSDLNGNIVVLGFIYTHCELPSMCPMTMSKLVRTQKLVKKSGIERVQFLLVSFDPERDRPQRLKKTATSYQVDVSSFRFATGTSDQILTLSRRLNTYFRRNASGQFEHDITISLFDSQGILRDRFVGTAWPTEELFARIEELARPRAAQERIAGSYASRAPRRGVGNHSPQRAVAPDSP